MTEYAVSPGGIYIPSGSKPLYRGSANNGVSTLLTFDEVYHMKQRHSFMEARRQELRDSASADLEYWHAQQIAENESWMVFTERPRQIATFANTPNRAWYEFGTGTPDDRDELIATYGITDVVSNFVPFSNGRLRAESEFALSIEEVIAYCEAFKAALGESPQTPFVAADPDEDLAFI
ncbi:TPA: hypothetical protein EYO12_04110 [Candidatus Saccharibacteria bacterium]|nr:hypothetical protein [Candidatus Saccharibacteria bacterium]HIO87781.1 hypothetical protein [Candidatus Saccharibacteria bacterium]